MKDTLPEGMIAAARVVEAAENNSSESDLSVFFWKRSLLQRIGENELEIQNSKSLISLPDTK